MAAKSFIWGKAAKNGGRSPAAVKKSRGSSQAKSGVRKTKKLKT